MLTDKLTEHPTNQPALLRNVICPYCGITLNADNTTKEHVIGRRFVPKGKLENQWNLIVRACGPCNNRKADLENDISAITLHPEYSDMPPGYDAGTIADAQRKAKNAISRRTKKPVKDSQENIKFNMPFGGGATIGFNFTSPPQIDQNRAFELARSQLAALFFWLTYHKDEERGRFWREGCYLLMMTRRADWGNSIMTDFGDAVIKWEPRLILHTADGFYRACIRRHPTVDCWSWALEWNGTTRLTGFFGDKGAAQEIVDSLRKLQMDHHDLGNGDYVRSRIDVPLDPESDNLFQA